MSAVDDKNPASASPNPGDSGGGSPGDPSGGPASGLKRFLIRAFLVFSLGALIVAGVSFFYINSFLSRPGSLPAHDVEVIIQPGVTFAAITPYLKEKGVISDERRFIMLAEWEKLAGRLRTGRFMVNTGWTPGHVLDHLVNANPILDKVTLPEGLPWWEVGRRLETAGMVRFADFEKVLRDPEFLRRWGIPLGSAEGYLFPDTYLLMRPIELDEASAKTVIGRLLDNFWRRVATFYDTGKPDANERLQLASSLILASIVEKETALPAERARIAGVYVNRLNHNMLLQADPTVIYGLGPDFSGRLRRSDLNNPDNPYNTYKLQGLPPGPICSPGLAAIRAALFPETNDYLYFVARGDGGHQFSTNLAAHNQAVRTYILNKDTDQSP